jgi:PPOX class probable F420-dependent enzyme
VIDLGGETRELLDSARVAHLATADQYARPHVIPIVFVVREGRLYFPLDRKPKRDDDWHLLRRVRNIETNGRVSIVIDRYDEDWTKLAWVLIEGVATILETGEERDGAVGELAMKYEQYGADGLEGRPVVRVVIERTVQWRAGSAAR